MLQQYSKPRLVLLSTIQVVERPPNEERESDPNQRKQGIVDFEARNPNDLASIVNQSHINQGQTTPNRSVQSGDTDFSVHRVIDRRYQSLPHELAEAIGMGVKR